jgi:hypothetical protein
MYCSHLSFYMILYDLHIWKNKAEVLNAEFGKMLEVNALKSNRILGESCNYGICET